jgi:lipid-A-disaccharide synthase
MANQPTIMIVAGESSGDLHGAGLMRELNRLAPGTRITGMGGRRMLDAGLQPCHTGEGVFGTAGLVEVLSGLSRILSCLRTLKTAMRSGRPQIFVAVDFPDFNFRLARYARSLGIPVAYFISPQVWAWRRGRIKTLAWMVDRMLVIFPFEEALFRAGGIDTLFVGHPLLDVVGPEPAPEDRQKAREQLGLAPQDTVVALLPGSRKNEVRRILPVVLQACREIASSRPLQLVLVRAAHLEKDTEMDRLLAEPFVPGLTVVPESQLYPVLRSADAAVVASGTATLETALHLVPMTVVYRVNPLTYFLGKALVRLEHFAMVNLIAEREVATELIQGDLTAQRLKTELLRLLEPDTGATIRDALRDVRRRLGTPGAYRRSAEQVLDLVSQSFPDTRC